MNAHLIDKAGIVVGVVPFTENRIVHHNGKSYAWSNPGFAYYKQGEQFFNYFEG